MKIFTRFVLVLFLVCLFSAERVHAATYTAVSCAQTDVQNAINSAAASGDTVNIPACGCTSWSGHISVMKSLVISGAGMANTCISNLGGFTLSSTGANGTVIKNIHFYSAGQQGKTTAINITTNNNGTYGTAVTGWRITQNNFDSYGSTTFSGNGGINVWNGSSGLIDNNLFSNTDGTLTLIYVMGQDKISWSEADPVGTGNMTFIEDNKFLSGSTGMDHVISANWGGSYALRCNYMGGNTFKGFVDTHGYGHGTYRRSARDAEVYGNYVDNSNYNSYTFNFRGGTGRVFANRWTNGNTWIQLTDYRMISNGQSMAYPTNTGDCTSGGSNCPSGSELTCCADHEGYPCCDQIGRIRDTVGGTTRQAGNPFYLWDNTTTQGAAISVRSAEEDGRGFIQSGRDYFVGTTPPGYTPYQYPHPMRGLPATTTCLPAGADSQAGTGITFWQGGTGSGTSSAKPGAPTHVTVQ